MSYRLDRSRVAAVLVACAGLSTVALGQTGANIVRDLRPMVSISLQPPIPLAPFEGNLMGIYDTGALGVFVPPPAAAHWGLPAAYTAPAGAPFNNYSRVTNPYTISVGSMYGGSFAGPQVNTAAGEPTQIFGATSNLNRTAAFSRPNIAAATNYYNGRANNAILGAGFYNGTATSRPTVGFVDPANAGYTPFEFGSISAASPAGIGPSGRPGDLFNSTYSNVTILSPGVDVPLPLGGSIYIPNTTVPTLQQNLNPNFLFSMTMTPVDGAGVAQASFTSFTRPVDGATAGYRPRVTVDATNQLQLNRSLTGYASPPGDIANNSLAPLGNYVADTGAPTTDAPAAGINRLLGTDIFNGFGQFWDMSANPGNNNQPSLLFFGPRLQGDRDLVSTGALITVDRLSSGAPRTGVNQYTQFGRPAINIPAGGTNPDGSTNVNGTPIPATSGTFNATTIFRTHMTQSNAGYISGAEAMGLQGATINNLGDAITSLSVGGERIAQRSTVYFSVDRASQGQAAGTIFVPGVGTIQTGSIGFGGGVTGQRALNQHAADIFQADNARRPTPIVSIDINGNQQITGVNGFGTNSLRYNQDVMGLAGNAGPLANAAGWGNEDNMRDFDLRSIDGMIAANAATTMRNLDPVIRAPGDTHNPGSALGVAARTDVLGQNFNTFITLDTGSVSLAANGWSAADVLVNNTAINAPGLRRFASAAQAGLGANNAIDGISLQRVGLQANLPVIEGTNYAAFEWAVDGYVPLNSFTPYGGTLEDFGGIDTFFGFNADLMLFSLAPGSAALNFFDIILGRNLSAADIFITDFDGTFQLYAAAESLGLLASDNVDGLDVMPVPTPASLMMLALGGVFASRRRRQA